MQFSTVGACLLGLLSLQNTGNYCTPLSCLELHSPCFETNRVTPASFVSFQLYATILIRPVGVSLVQVSEGLVSGFPDTQGLVDKDFKRICGN